MSEQHKHHVLPLSTYLMVGSVLLGLTFLTVLVAQYQFGEWNLIVAMAVAAIKATLVLLFFMHLKYDNKLYAYAFLISIAFLAVFIALTMIDTLSRDEFGRGSIDKQVQYQTAPGHAGGEGKSPAAPALKPVDSVGSSAIAPADSVKPEAHK